MGISAAPQIYTIAPDQTKLAINSVPYLKETTIIPVNFKVGTAGIYKLVLKDIEGFDDIPVFLEDLKENKVLNIKSNMSYNYFASPDDETERFLLHFSAQDNPYATEITSGDNLIIYSFDHKIVIQRDEIIPADVMVFNLIGQLIYSGKMVDLVKEIYVLGEPGYYIVKVVEANEITSRKVIIK